MNLFLPQLRGFGYEQAKLGKKKADVSGSGYQRQEGEPSRKINMKPLQTLSKQKQLQTEVRLGDIITVGREQLLRRWGCHKAIE